LNHTQASPKWQVQLSYSNHELRAHIYKCSPSFCCHFFVQIQIYHLALKVPVQESAVKESNTAPVRPYLSVRECEGEDDLSDNPPGRCRLEKYEWTEGKEFIFDDSFTHWAENPTDQERLVLFLHIKRIDFKGWREELIASIMCYIFSWKPFESVSLVIKGTDAMCALDTSETTA